MNLENIPQELKQIPRWVGHKNKVPINLRTGAAASSNDLNTWVPFELAIRRYIQYGCNGLGFVLCPPFVGIDLDDCVTENGLNEFGKKIVQDINSYSEYSPSKTGIHIICKGTVERAVKKPEIEIYNTGRYFTMTGDTLSNLPVRFVEKELQDLIPSSIENDTSNKPGWIAESLQSLQKGNIHNETIRIVGKLHQQRWTKEDIFQLLKPHIERCGGEIPKLVERIESVSRYPITQGDKILDQIKNETDDTYSMSSFLALDDKVEWIVPQIISAKSIGFVAGLPESRKSWMMIDLAIEAAKGGGYWLGKFPVKESKVLYIDQERDKSEAKRRFGAVMKAKNLSDDCLDGKLYLKCQTTIRFNLQNSYEALRRELLKIKPDLVLFDSFATAHTSEENNRKDIQEVLEKIKALRNEIGCTFIFVHHENKYAFHTEDQPEVSISTMAGSVAIPAASEFVLTVRNHDAESSMVFHTKSTQGKKVEPFLLKIEDVKDKQGAISVKAY